jgi:parallel beta-helix repeat protein
MVLALAGASNVAPASAAHVSCGDEITTDTVLDSDVGPCAEGLTVTSDNITLDLNGFRVFGGSGGVGEGAGIFVEDSFGVLITGGTVSDFDAGIVIERGFDNVVDGVEARDNIGSGSTDFGDGILISSSSNNVIRNSQIIHNGPFDGIAVIVTNTTPVGRSFGNLIEDNIVRDNNITSATGTSSDIGIRLEPGSFEATVQRNLVQGSGLDGIQVFANSGGNEVRSNLVIGNGSPGVPTSRFGSGILVAGNGNRVEGNTVQNNVANGIFVNSLNNTILDNEATGNATGPMIPTRATFDLRDGRADCDNNLWRGNTFVTASPVCTTR